MVNANPDRNAWKRTSKCCAVSSRRTRHGPLDPLDPKVKTLSHSQPVYPNLALNPSLNPNQAQPKEPQKPILNPSPSLNQAQPKEPRHPMLNLRQKEPKLQSPLSQLKNPAIAKVV